MQFKAAFSKILKHTNIFSKLCESTLVKILHISLPFTFQVLRMPLVLDDC